jgi:hypothetical protein
VTFEVVEKLSLRFKRGEARGSEISGNEQEPA